MRVLAMGVVCALLGCARGSSTVPTVEFAAEDEFLFDNSVDLVDKPAIVESEWRGKFERRVTRADVIAVIKIESLSSDEDRRGSSYRLTARVIDGLKGRSNRELILRAHDDEPGFQSVRVNEDRLLRDPFVAFVKWKNDAEADQPLPRWHLSPDSPEVRDKVVFFLSPPSGDDRTQVEVLGP
ncbi:MAG: hypothetical protein OES69_05305 [Myxococcales bacterium]|nr:hypothetical protein [Myxococcales bacterium]MDH3843333.1 hypothetical protein [Myxococcales bacterium]